MLCNLKLNAGVKGDIWRFIYILLIFFNLIEALFMQSVVYSMRVRNPMGKSYLMFPFSQQKEETGRRAKNARRARPSGMCCSSDPIPTHSFAVKSFSSSLRLPRSPCWSLAFWHRHHIPLQISSRFWNRWKGQYWYEGSPFFILWLLVFIVSIHMLWRDWKTSPL